MATPIKLKRSAVAGKRPGLSDLQLGELALNTYDGSIYVERDTGGVGIATTIANVTPWTENYGGESIYYNNDVGIGTVTPGKTLDIWNTSGAADLRLKTTSNSFNSLTFDSARAKDTQFAIIDGRWNDKEVTRIQFVTGSDDTNYDDGFMAFHTRKSGESLSERLRIDSSGNFDIPFTNNGTGLRQKIRFVTESSYFDEVAYISADRTAVSNAPTDLVFGTGALDGGSVNTQERLRITSAGDVGIGEDTPGAKLAIYDSDGHNLYLRNSWSGEAGIGFGGGSNVDGTGDANTAGRISVTASAPGGAATGYMSFKTNSGDDLEESLRITSDGKVGIGITNPQADLQVGTGVTVYGNSGIVSATKFYGAGTNETLNISADTGSGAGIILGSQTFSLVGTANEVNTNADGQEVQIGLPNSVTIANDLTVGAGVSVVGITTVGFVTATDAWVSGIVTASGFAIPGGLSSQFLKANGGTDNTSYITSGEADLDLILGNGNSTTKGMKVGLTTFSDDVEFHGSVGVTSLTWDKSANKLMFNDGIKATFGDGSDLTLRHNGSNSYLENITGNLIIDNSPGVDMYINSGNDIYIRPQGTENGIKVIGDGAVELYHDNNLVFKTVGTGVSVANAGLKTATIYGPEEIWIDPHPIGVGTTSGIVRIKGDLYVDGSEFIVDVEKIELGDFVVGVASTVQSDSLLDGAGLGIGSMNSSTNKHYHALLYDHDGGTAPSLTSNDNFSVLEGKGYYIQNSGDNALVLSSTTLGSSVINSSLTSVGTLGSLTVSGNINANGNIVGDDSTNISGINSVTANDFKSTVATGTAPFVVASTTKVANLNADLLDGRDTSSSGGNNVVMVTDGSGDTSIGSGTFTAGTFDGSLATTNLSGTITNAQLAGSIANNKLANDSVSYGGVEVDLGAVDATPAFDLQDATNYPYTSLTGIVTHIVGDTTPQLGGDLDANSKSIYGVGIITASGIDCNGTLEVSSTTNFDSTVKIADKIEHLGDDNTNIRFPDADTFAVETAGSERLRINSSGHVMIGTTTAGAANADELTLSYNNTGVGGGDQGRCGMTIRSGTNTSGAEQDGYIYFANGTSGDNPYKGTIVYEHDNDALKFGTNGGVERLRITSTGDVGIGTGIPDEILHIGQVGTGSNNYNEGRLKIGGFPGTGYGLLIGYDNRGSGRTNIVNANNSGGDANRINIGFGAITASGAPTTEVVTINQSGNVGIGSAIPGTEFEVLGAGTVANFKGTGGNCFIGLTDVDAGAGVGYIGSDGGDLLFQTPGSSYSTKLQITSAGNVGIGSLIPDQKLVVNGNIEARASGWFIARSGDNSNYAYIKNPETSGAALAFNTSGEKMRITQAGNVGIGTDDPNSRLDVTKDSDTDYSATTDQRSSAQIIARNSTAGTNNFASISLVNGGGTQAEASINLIETDDYLGDIAFKSRTGGTTWSEKLRITSSGWQQGHAGYAAVGINTFASWARTGGAIRAEVGYNAVTTDYIYFGTGTNHPLALRTNNTTALYIDANQKVGIGTVAPGSPLEVNGGSALDTATFNSHHANGTLINLQRSGTNKGFLGSGKNIADATGGVDDIGLRSNANLIFASGGGTERLRIASDGAWGLAGANYGSSGQVLTSNGSGSAPTWQDSSGGGGGGGAAGLWQQTDVGINTVSSVGIGTTNPDSLLTLNATSNPTFKIKTSGTIRSALIADTGNNETVLASYESYPLVFSTSTGGGTAERLRIASDGSQCTITSGAHDGGLEILAGNNNQESRIRLQGKSSGGTAHEWYLSASRSADRFGISNGSTSHFIILDSGKVGIGSLTPDEALDVVGNVDIKGGANSLRITSTAPAVKFTDSDASGGYGMVGVNNTSGSLVLRSDDGDALDDTYMGFEVDGSQRFKIESNGYVTIPWDSSSQYTLFRVGDVSGTSEPQLQLYTDTSANDAVINSRNNHDLALRTNNTERLRITSDGDVEFKGSVGVTSLTWDKSAGSLIFKDNNKAVFGDGSDLSIYWTGSRAKINSLNSNLDIESDYIALKNQGNSKEYLNCTNGGAVKIYHDDQERFSTTGIGVSIAGAGIGNTAYIEGPSEIWIDPHPAGVGTTSGIVRIRGDLYVDGTEFIVDVDKLEIGDFQIGIASTAGTNAALDGAGIGIGSTNIRKTITWNNATSALMSSENWNLGSGKHYEIAGTDVLTSTTLGSGVVNSSLTSVGTLTGLTVSGTSTFQDNITLSNDKQFGFGGDSDLYIKHSDGHGANFIVSSIGDIEHHMASSKKIIKGFNNSGTPYVNLYHDNNIRLTTTDAGISITGSILEIVSNTCLIDLMETSATNHRIRNGNGNFYIQKVSDDKETTTNQLVIDGGTGEVGLYHSGAKKLATTSTGVVITGIATATDFDSTSDIRLKTNIQPIDDPLAKVIQIEGVSFNWKENNRPALGVIADQVEEIIPELVHGDDPKTVNYNGLIGLLIEAVKEQQTQIDSLKNRLSKLE